MQDDEIDQSWRLRAAYPYEYEHLPFLTWVVQQHAQADASADEIERNMRAWLLESLIAEADLERFDRFVSRFVREIASGEIDPLLEKRQAAQAATERSLIDQLIQQTNLYSTSASFISLLEFVAKMRGFAPFNAMLLHAQKPGITHAATATDWARKFNRIPKPDARPLIVMQAMGPVGFVFDILDTEGDDLPPEAFAFPTLGDLSAARMGEIIKAIERSKIAVIYVDKGDGAAGSVSRGTVIVKGLEQPVWKIRVNKNHAPAVQFVTLAHELAHLFLGHLGDDRARGVNGRKNLGHAVEEVEAETVAWLVAHRNGLRPKSEAYLDKYKLAFKALDIATILRAANAVETALGISAAQLAKVQKT